MKRILIVVVLVLAAAILGLWRSSGGVREGLSRAVGASEAHSEGSVRDEIRKSFELQPGARIDVLGVNGKVDIQTSEGKTTEVYVLRTAESRDSLDRREVKVEQTPTGLTVKSRTVKHSLWAHIFGSKAQEDVTIKAPREIALALKGINGSVTGGDIEGALEIKGVNGRVDIGQANESANVSGVNGNISVGLNSLGNSGARFSGINGNIELKLAGTLNAQLTAKGMNGSVRSEISAVTVEKDDHGSRYSARIGTGGSPITVSGINGNVRLTRAASVAVADEKKTDSKATAKSSEK